MIFISNGLALTALLAAADVHDHAEGKEEPTFHRDVAPIIFANCSECHRPNQVAPFSLLTYEDVKKRAKQIAEVTASRFMPPWLPERAASGEVKFHSERRLSDEEISIIQAWVEQDTPEGDLTNVSSAPKFDDGWKRGEPHQIVAGPEYTIPAEDRDTIRTFVIPVSLPLRKLIKAIDFQCANPRVVHHVSFLIDNTKTAKLLDDDDPRPGYRGMGDIGLNLAGSFGTWSPNSGAVFFPDGMGRTMPKDIDLVIEMHFNPTGKPETIKPEIALYFVQEQTQHQVLNVSVGSFFIDIAAGERQYRIADSMELPADVKLLGLAPHAHYICRRIKAEAQLADGTCLNLLTINDWDFNWQQEYRYREPIALPAGTKLHAEFVYDNSDENLRNPNHPPKRVRSGATASDEMALMFFSVVAADENQRPMLEQAHQQELIQRMKEAQQKRAAESTGQGISAP